MAFPMWGSCTVVRCLRVRGPNSCHQGLLIASRHALRSLRSSRSNAMRHPRQVCRDYSHSYLGSHSRHQLPRSCGRCSRMTGVILCNHKKFARDFSCKNGTLVIYKYMYIDFYLFIHLFTVIYLFVSENEWH